MTTVTTESAILTLTVGRFGEFASWRMNRPYFWAALKAKSLGSQCNSADFSEGSSRFKSGPLHLEIVDCFCQGLLEFVELSLFARYSRYSAVIRAEIFSAQAKGTYRFMETFSFLANSCA